MQGLITSSAQPLRRCFTGFLLLGLLAVAGCAKEDAADDPVVVSKNCQQNFDPAAAAQGADCAPTYEQYCPPPPEFDFYSTAPASCDDVQTGSGSVTVDGATSSYIVLSPAPSQKTLAVQSKQDTVGRLLIALHWAGANGPTMADRMRLRDLVVAKNMTVVLPDAPGAVPSWGNSVLVPISTAEQRIAVLDAIIEDVSGPTKASGPVLVAGVSGGGIMAFQYACARSESVSGALIVAAEIRPADLEACQPVSAVATVQIHGSDDLVAPYEPVPLLSPGVEAIFEKLYANNGCVADDLQQVILPNPNETFVSDIELNWLREGCASGVGNALIKVNGGGHNWPGFDGPVDVLPFNIFGPKSTGFDATFQGLELLGYLGG